MHCTACAFKCSLSAMSSAVAYTPVPGSHHPCSGYPITCSALSCKFKDSCELLVGVWPVLNGKLRGFLMQSAIPAE